MAACLMLRAAVDPKAVRVPCSKEEEEDNRHALAQKLIAKTLAQADRQLRRPSRRRRRTKVKIAVLSRTTRIRMRLLSLMSTFMRCLHLHFLPDRMVKRLHGTRNDNPSDSMTVFPFDEHLPLLPSSMPTVSPSS